MCLGVPGKVIEIQDNPQGLTMGRVSFSGVIKEVCLAYVPDVEVGDYVIVHVGFAISKVEEEEAQQVFQYLTEMAELAELEHPQTDEPGSTPL
ncbi:MAG: HypC/HybG/HupF family hydrogenase formation chaperone [Chloroflexi bacterium]|nr:HypC/HybG/HupF family hydrogenase formation chaperone [Chloroflexota bacterium]